MPRPPEFSEDDKVKMLLWCARHCCLCGRNASTDIEIAHIDRRAGNGLDNGIPLCYDCHAKIGHYNREHPRGNKYKPRELRARRNQIYDEHTRNIVPPIHFYLDQTRADGTQSDLPFVVFHLQHLSDALPARLRIVANLKIGNSDPQIAQDGSGYYTGTTIWNINPRTVFWGGFGIIQEQLTRVNANERFIIQLNVTVIDQFDREHPLLPQSWTWVNDAEHNRRFWNLEPRSFCE